MTMKRNVLPFPRLDRYPVQTFLLKVTTQNEDGSTSMIKTVPCDAGADLDICLVEVNYTKITASKQ